MTTVTKSVTFESKGRTVEFKVERTKGVQDNISYADGWNISLGKETVDSIYIELIIDGKSQTTSYSAPSALATDSYNYEELKAKGAYGTLGNAYLSEINYNRLVDLIEEAEAELGETEEYKAVKAVEAAKEENKIASEKAAIEQYQKLIDSGMCPKCESWCYGDCESH